MKLTTLDITIFVAFILAVIGLGLYASRRTGGTKRDYFLAGDKLPWWLVGGSIVAANVSSHHFVGVMGTAYSKGFSAMTIEWGAILLGFNALLWIFLPFYLRNGFFTMPEFLQRRFGTPARTTFAGLILVIYIFVEISAVLLLGARSLEVLFGIPERYTVIALALLTGLYTITGGLKAVVWTEMLQLVVLLMGGLVLSFATINKVGGWDAVMAKSSEWHLLLPSTDPDFPWTMFLGGIVCISVFYCAANQFIVQRTLAAKDEWHARMGIVFTDYLKFFLPLIIIIPGLVAPTLLPNLEKPDQVFPELVRTLLPAGLVGLVMAGLVAAIMSHVSGALNSCTTIACLDFYIPFFNKEASEAKAVRFGKIFGVVLVIMGIIWAEVLAKNNDKPIFLYLLNAYGYVTPGIATMFLMGIFWKRTTQAGALVAGALTFPLSAGFEVFSPKPNAVTGFFDLVFRSLGLGDMIPSFHAFVLSVNDFFVWAHLGTPESGISFFNRTGIVFWVCMASCALVSLVTRPKPEAEIANLIWNKESLKLPPELREKMRGLRNPTLWWAIVTAAVVFMYIRYA